LWSVLYLQAASDLIQFCRAVISSLRYSLSSFKVAAKLSEIAFCVSANFAEVRSVDSVYSLVKPGIVLVVVWYKNHTNTPGIPKAVIKAVIISTSIRLSFVLKPECSTSIGFRIRLGCSPWCSSYCFNQLANLLLHTFSNLQNLGTQFITTTSWGRIFWGCGF